MRRICGIHGSCDVSKGGYFSGNITNAVKYMEDLRAFRAITKAFKYRGIVACDVDPMVVGFDQTRYFNLNVDELADAVSVI